METNLNPPMQTSCPFYVPTTCYTAPAGCSSCTFNSTISKITVPTIYQEVPCLWLLTLNTQWAPNSTPVCSASSQTHQNQPSRGPHSPSLSCSTAFSLMTPHSSPSLHETLLSICVSRAQLWKCHPLVQLQELPGPWLDSCLHFWISHALLHFFALDTSQVSYELQLNTYSGFRPLPCLLCLFKSHTWFNLGFKCHFHDIFPQASQTNAVFPSSIDLITLIQDRPRIGLHSTFSPSFLELKYKF